MTMPSSSRTFDEPMVNTWVGVGITVGVGLGLAVWVGDAVGSITGVVPHPITDPAKPKMKKNRMIPHRMDAIFFIHAGVN